MSPTYRALTLRTASLALVMALSIGLPDLARAASTSAEGCWRVEISLPFPMGSKKLSVCFEKSETGLKGKVQKDGKGPWEPMVSAEQDGTKVGFVVEGENGKLFFTGTLESDSKLEGKVKAPKGTFDFRGERNK